MLFLYRFECLQKEHHVLSAHDVHVYRVLHVKKDSIDLTELKQDSLQYYHKSASLAILL